MSKNKLLQEFVKLVLEMSVTPPAQPFELKGPVKKAGPRGWPGDYTITRSFTLKLTPEMADIMGFDESTLEDGMLSSEFSIGITCDYDWIRPRRGQTAYEGDEPGTIEVNDWMPVNIEELVLSPNDSSRFKAFLGGELTDYEIAYIASLHKEVEDVDVW